MSSQASLYQALGEMEGCRKLSEAFYAKVALDPVLRPFFPSGFHCAIESFARFLAQYSGGPCEYSSHSWWLSLREAHARFKIGPKDRDAWIETMGKVLAETNVEEPVRDALRIFFRESSAYLVNDSKSQLEIEEAEPARSCLHPEIATRWAIQCTLDDIVAAIRQGDPQRAVVVAESEPAQRHFERDRASFVGLLAAMAASRDPHLVEYLRGKLESDHGLLAERHGYGRTLLHAAAEGGNLGIVELLLRHGADPNAISDMGHPPLYSLANACAADSGPDVVRALVVRGANVNAQTGVKKCAALHMAARRGNIAVAETLLDCGADIEARDSQGETPLRRAVNCSQKVMVAALLARGADPHSKGSKGLTVFDAARGAIKQILAKKLP